MVFYSLGAHAERRRAIVAGAIGGVVFVGGDLVDLVSGGAALEDTVPAWFMLAAAYGVGFALRGQRIQSTLLARRAERLEQEREQRARFAVAEERVRIARELHDIIAHTISVMVVQAQAGQRVLEGEQASAREALGSIETTGRQALVEMRRLLGILRSEDASSPSPRDRAWRMSMCSPSGCGMRGCRSTFRSRASRGRCHWASTCPPTGSCRRR